MVITCYLLWCHNHFSLCCDVSDTCYMLWCHSQFYLCCDVMATCYFCIFVVTSQPHAVCCDVTVNRCLTVFDENLQCFVRCSGGRRVDGVEPVITALTRLGSMFKLNKINVVIVIWWMEKHWKFLFKQHGFLITCDSVNTRNYNENGYKS